MTQRRTRQEWFSLIDSFEISGLTHSQFCQSRQLSVHSFRAWLYRIRKLKEQTELPQFLPVLFEEQPEENSIPSTLQLEIGDLFFTFSNLPEPQYLAQLLAHLGCEVN